MLNNVVLYKNDKCLIKLSYYQIVFFGKVFVYKTFLVINISILDGVFMKYSHHLFIIFFIFVNYK